MYCVSICAQRGSVLRNALLPPKLQQHTLHIAAVIHHRLRGQPRRHVVPLGEIISNGAVASRDHPKRSILHLGELPREVIQCRFVWLGSSFDAAIILIASSRESSIKPAFPGIGIVSSFLSVDGDSPK